jgi:hypothetical protein
MSTIEHDMPDELDETDVLHNSQEAAALTSGDQPSILDQLVAAREEAVDNQTVDLELPGYKGLLWARYGLLDNSQLGKIAKRVRRQYKKAEEQVLAMSCDILIASCEGFYHRTENGELQSITKDGDVLNYHNAGDFLKFEVGSARQSVIAVFAGNEIAVIDQQVRLARWMRNTGIEVDSDLLGE